MTKIHRPTRLIGYDTELNVKRRECGQPAVYKPMRARTLIYAVLIVLIGGFMTLTLATRGDMRVSVLHDRNPLTVRLKDGGVRNGYTMRLSNMQSKMRRFNVAIAGVDGATPEIVGVAPDAQGHIVIEVGPDQTRETRLLLAAPDAAGKSGQTPITVTMTDAQSGVAVEARDVFVWP